jgi:hypothetical protein
VEVESQWTALERERMGLHPTVVKREAMSAPTLPLPKQER